MKLGDIFTGTIRDLTSSGQGVTSHPNGTTVFVSGIWIGEEGEFKINQIKGRVAFARLLKVTQASDHRITPRCAHHGFKSSQCGGCPWQFMDYHAQLAAKQDRVEQAIRRLAPKANIHAIIGSEKTYGYRNRAQLKSDGERLGYLAAQSNQLVGISECPILTEHNQQTLDQLLAQLPNPQWQRRKKNQYTSIDIDETVSADTASINQRLPFHQANGEQNQTMRAWITKKLESLPFNDAFKALELFCGSGNFTEQLAQFPFQRIVAVEGSDTATQALANKALPRVDVMTTNLFDEKAFSKVLSKHKDADLLLLDPPRAGLKETKNLFGKKHNLRHVLYISCDLATFTRDIALFCQAGYTLEEIQPVDQFPHTPHIELMGYLRKA